ncbi:hypothetical protein D8674_034803 [Pyrus ussuriensis x Pyrus communis]|uniref:Uncharacterized protein n=1 Tax=Pyrus ussuriensis x Pyrus communis TaxID=2448454 RepID=A0A5N5GBG7_9ROSA|nr:hypothetical protein D8674_034803 [Pyrus ussuriensis x Pyrus communis]
MKAPLPHHAQIQEEVQMLVAKQLCGFQRIDTTDVALHRDVANLSRSPFTNEIEWTEPSWKFNPPHFTWFRGDKDLDKHLMHYRSAMTLYTNNDALMCKIFATTLQVDYPFFEELIMGENPSLTNSYALAQKHSLWDEEKRSHKPLEQLRKDAKSTQKKVSNKVLDNKSKPGGRRPKTYTRFSVPVSQILRDLKDKPWFKTSPPPLKGDTFKMDQTKYCAFHKGAHNQ